MSRVMWVFIGLLAAFVAIWGLLPTKTGQVVHSELYFHGLINGIFITEARCQRNNLTLALPPDYGSIRINIAVANKDAFEDTRYDLATPDTQLSLTITTYDGEILHRFVAQSGYLDMFRDNVAVMSAVFYDHAGIQQRVNGQIFCPKKANR